MKRLSIALASLGLCVSTFPALAATALSTIPLPNIDASSAAKDPAMVMVPRLPGGFVIGGSAFYLQPSATNGDLDYASVNTTNTTSPFFFHSSLKSIEPGYDWGWGANLGYIFPNTGNDVNLSWFTFNTDDTDTVGPLPVEPNFIFINPIFSSNNLDATDFARSKAEYDLDQVDLTVGQFIDVGCRLILHPNVGLRWADPERKLNSVYSGTFTQTLPLVTQILVNSLHTQEKSDFSGIGPIAGLDASYYIGMGFGAVAHVDSALLAGNIDASTASQQGIVTTNGLGIISLNNLFQNFKADGIQRVVPVVDMKLGADYTFVFNNAANSALTLEAGWQFSNYFNAIDRLNIINPDIDNSHNITQGNIISRTTSDFVLQGPYASLVLHV